MVGVMGSAEPKRIMGVWGFAHSRVRGRAPDEGTALYHVICKLFTYRSSTALKYWSSMYDILRFGNIWHSEKFESF